MLKRFIAASAFVAVVGLGACVGLDKPQKVAECSARNNCSDNPQGGAPGAGGGPASSGGGAGTVSSGGAAGGATTAVHASGGNLGGATALDAYGVGGTVASGGVGVDAGVDIPLGSGGAPGSGGVAPGTGGAIDAAIATGGVSGSGGKVGSGGAATGGATATGGTTATGGATTADARTTPDASPLLNGLVAYYTFDSASGTDLPDSSGKGNVGKLSIGTLSDGSTPTATGYELVTGKVGKALALHKAGLGYVKVPVEAFANATDITIALWVNVTTSQNWQRILDVGVDAKISQNTQTGTKYLNLVPKNDGSNMLFSITTNGYGSEQTLTAGNAATGTWTHIAVVLVAGGGGKLYVNGAQVNANTSLSLRASDLGAIDYAFIGKSQFSADPWFDGSVDEFRVYNRALSASQIQDLYTFTGP